MNKLLIVALIILLIYYGMELLTANQQKEYNQNHIPKIEEVNPDLGTGSGLKF